MHKLAKYLTQLCILCIVVTQGDNQREGCRYERSVFNHMCYYVDGYDAVAFLFIGNYTADPSNCTIFKRQNECTTPNKRTTITVQIDEDDVIRSSCSSDRLINCSHYMNDEFFAAENVRYLTQYRCIFEVNVTYASSYKFQCIIYPPSDDSDESQSNTTKALKIKLPKQRFVNVTRKGWLIEVDTFPSGNVTLDCRFNVKVNCRWKRNDRVMETGHRYRYVRGNGANSHDCSLHLFSVKNIDITTWVCEGYSSTDQSYEPKFQMLFRLSKQLYESESKINSTWQVHRCSTEGDRFEKHIVIISAYQTRTIRIKKLEKTIFACELSTFVDTCSWRFHEELSLYRPSKCYEIDTDNCSHTDPPTLRPITCEAKKELIQLKNLPVSNYRAVILLSCYASRPVNCSWQHNHEFVEIDDYRLSYRSNRGINTYDCSIKITQPRDNDDGFWLCLKQIDRDFEHENPGLLVLGGYQLHLKATV